jgi:hypothetical protein
MPTGASAERIRYLFATDPKHPKTANDLLANFRVLPAAKPCPRFIDGHDIGSGPGSMTLLPPPEGLASRSKKQ